jgi:ABC-2 type transport system permease protein
MVVALLIVTVLPLVVLYLGALLAGMDIAHHTEHFAFGLLAALLYSLVFSAIGLLIAAATPRRGFGVAAIMGGLVVSGIVANIIYAVSGGPDQTATGGATWAYAISPGAVVQRFVDRVCGLSSLPGTPGGLGAVVFGLEILAILAGSYVLLLRRYRKI